MNLSRKWLNEFVSVEINDKEFAEAMTLSGSKVEITEDLGREISDVVVGRILSMERHPDSDHMWVCQMDVGQSAPIQIVTGAWNVHAGDLVPVALDKSTLPGGKRIESGKLRGILSEGMLCSLKELGLDERDFPYAVAPAAALLNDYKALDPEKPSIPTGIIPGYKLFGNTVAAFVTEVTACGDGTYCVHCDSGGLAHTITTTCANIHAMDTLALEKEREHICTLSDLHAQQAEFPHCIRDGIFVLQEQGIAPGDAIKPIIGADDHVVEFEITPNRPDCLSIIGLAREAAATFGKPLRLHQPTVQALGQDNLLQLLDVDTLAPELCARYTARMVRNVTIAPSPKWMRERLRAMGVRPINNIVDITNYVMLEYGQPMHAFDYRYVKGGKIIVRRANEGESLTTLDGVVRKLTPNMLVIADETRAVGLAGIMGGENSEIMPDTVDVVFESANFDGTAIRKTALSLGMRTEASGKFEKGLDPMNTLPAVERACELVELLGAGVVVPGVIDILNHVPHPTTLSLRGDKINALLGTQVPLAEMGRILEKIGFVVNGDTITVPSWRSDVVHYSDLAEEIARFHGYNNIPSTLVSGETTQGGYTPQQKLEQGLGLLCRSMGYHEIITYSFISPAFYDKIRWANDDPRRSSMRICNPLGEDTSIMRTTVLPSMLDILSRNYNLRNKSARLYELGRTYFKREDGMADEPKVLCLGGYGGGMDFFGLKGAVEAILTDLRIREVTFRAVTDNPSYHPGRCAEVFAKDARVGVFGQVHPLVAQTYGVDEALYCGELSFDALLCAKGADPQYAPLPKFPSVTRDIALLCDEAVPVGALERAIRAGTNGLLKQVALFDIYRGVNLPQGKKSVAFNLTLRSEERSLTSEEADADVKSILQVLAAQCGAILR